MEKELFRLPKRTGAKHKAVNMGDILVNFLAGDTANKIDGQKLLGIDDTPIEKLRKILDESDFITQRTAAGEDMGLHGNIFLVMLRDEDEWRMSYFKPMTYTRKFTKVLEMVAETDKVISTGTMSSLPLYYRWRILKDKETIGGQVYEKGRVIREGVTLGKDKVYSLNNNDQYVYPAEIDFIPGKIIRNNAKERPDWVIIMDILYELNIMSNEMGIEWEYIKTQLQDSGTFGNGESAKTRQTTIEGGGRVYSTYSPNGKFAAQFQAIISGSQTENILLQMIVFLEDRALKYIYQGRDIEDGGTNKHNLQVGIFQEAASNYIQIKKWQRERDYTDFFKNVVSKVTGIKELGSIAVMFDSSEYEKGKLEGMKAEKKKNDVLDAQAAEGFARANKTDVEAEVLKNPPKEEAPKETTGEAPAEKKETKDK